MHSGTEERRKRARDGSSGRLVYCIGQMAGVLLGATMGLFIAIVVALVVAGVVGERPQAGAGSYTARAASLWSCFATLSLIATVAFLLRRDREATFGIALATACLFVFWFPSGVRIVNEIAPWLGYAGHARAPFLRPHGDPRPHVTVAVNGVRLLAVVDTGATASVIKPRTARALQLEAGTTEPRDVYWGLGGQELKAWRTGWIGLHLGAMGPYDCDLLVVDKGADEVDDTGGFKGWDMLLGWDFLARHGGIVDYSTQELYLEDPPQVDGR